MVVSKYTKEIHEQIYI